MAIHLVESLAPHLCNRSISIGMVGLSFIPIQGVVVFWLRAPFRANDAFYLFLRIWFSRLYTHCWLADALLSMARALCIALLSDASDADTDRGHITTVAHWLGVPCTIALSGLALLYFVHQRLASLLLDQTWPCALAVAIYLVGLWYRWRKGQALSLWIDSGAAGFPLLIVLYAQTSH